ncbi:hypothetical protein K504DRAFT_488437 [Pleomassaria siparia CBS 279.74]|uniref:Uncharacterized protein n=1 Tax=Pleomassaria siparia CBS 279.74 TaxID=1314801 RepID=A0A6G1KPB7_9PLEO|nr:hypothetical protein K504DRAFT_488437 [Pleomassaria siparia CBS 279.74]
MSLIETEGEWAVLGGCISSGKRKASEMIASLGLINDNPGSGNPRFFETDVNELNRMIKTEAHWLAARHSEEELLKKEALSQPVRDIAAKFGSRLWGRMARSHLLAPVPKTLYPAELYWDREKDRDVVEFYLRCWIIQRASRRIRDGRRIPREPGRRSAEDEAEESDNDAVSDPPISISKRGKAAKRLCHTSPTQMYPESQSHLLAGESSKSQAERIEPESDNGSLYAEPPRASKVNKRKTSDHQHVRATGKLPKLGTRKKTVPELSKNRNRVEDQYAVPHSPSTVLDLNPTTESFGGGIIQVTVGDSGSEYRPSSSPSVESEIEHVDDIMTEQMGAVHTFVLMPILTVLQGDTLHMIHDRGIDDSVIPGDALTSRPTDDEAQLVRENEGDRARSTTVVPRPFVIPSHKLSTEMELRLELFKLLLSYLNKLREFNLEEVNHLNYLLRRFWQNDMQNIQTNFRDRFAQMHATFDAWMELHTRLHKFQVTAEYFGRPGAGWQMHLRELSDAGKLRKRATASYARAELAETAKHMTRISEERINEDLCLVFDQLTQFPHCNGAEEFESVRQYNEDLLEWFR